MIGPIKLPRPDLGQRPTVDLMISAPSVTSVGLLLGLSLFLGLAFEDFFARTDTKRPGGIRTFPMLAAGRRRALPVRSRRISFPSPPASSCSAPGSRSSIASMSASRTKKASPMSGSSSRSLNVHAYLLGAIALALPPWVAVATTVTAVLLLTGREKLHALARRIAVKEIVTAGEFLILTGIILPLLAQRAGDDADDHHAASGLAGAGRGLLAVLRELSRPALLGCRGPRIMDGGARRPLFVDGNDGGAGAAGKDRIGDAAAGAGRHHARHRHHVSAHSGGRGVLQYDAGAGLGAAALRPFAGRPRGLRAAISVCKTGAAGSESAAVDAAAIRRQPAGARPRRVVCLSVRCRIARCRSGRRPSSEAPASIRSPPLSA